ncbi:MAG: LysM peptidoglycan-binding domain-containing protein [Candidatus Omnitrophica bacterium]|nr:LysM peptidoglycan-binding domain-containing protein [Candidatus Omnitrophota bacterium]
MRAGHRVFFGVIGVCLLSGCRTATQVVEVPRVDLEMPEGGNRGYLVGTPPPASGPGRTQRQMVETEIEVPAFGAAAPQPAAAPEQAGEAAAPEVELSPEAFAPIDSGAPVETYVVKKGDTLWTIAARSDVLGDGSKWRRIYDANRDQLKNPDQLRPGMTLRIPRKGAPAGERMEQGTK